MVSVAAVVAAVAVIVVVDVVEVVVEVVVLGADAVLVVVVVVFVVEVVVVGVVVVHRPPSNDAGVPLQFAHLRLLVAVAGVSTYCPGRHSRIGLHSLFFFPGSGTLDSYCPATHSSMVPQVVS